MGRPRSSMRAVSERQGRDAGGVVFTDDDLTRLHRLARWYCLSADHLARMEMPEATWLPEVSGLDVGGTTHEYDRKVYAIKRRLARLCRIEPVGSTVGPPVGSTIVGGGKTAWFCTPYGRTAADVPWRLTTTISPVIAPHAMAAADVGFQIESLRIPGGPVDGFPVLAEREVRSRIDLNGDDVAAEMESLYRNDGAGIRKSPDLAILDSTRRKYVAVEVERDRRRPISSYREKLIAYERNPGSVRAVWYLCDHQSVARRVARAATEVFGQNSTYPLRVRVLEHHPTFVRVPNLSADTNMMADLASLG